MIEQVQTSYADIVDNHAQLRDNNDTEKLTNIIIEEGKIVQFNVRLSFSLDFY